MKYQIRALGYDPESDELDLLINADSPQPAEAISLDHGIYVRRDFKSHAIVGAFIRGYKNFARQVAQAQEIPREIAQREKLADVFQAILDWQREVGILSSDLAAHLSEWPPEEKFPSLGERRGLRIRSDALGVCVAFLFGN